MQPYTGPDSQLFVFNLSMLALCTAVCGSYATAASRAFPEKAVRLIVPYSAGGPTDVLSRGLAQKLTQRWQQQVIVDLRPGANSIIGTQIAAASAPDGYSLLLALPAFAINPSIYKKLPYDTGKDFIPVSEIASTSYLLLANTQVAANSVAELIALAKASPGKISFGSGGNGSPAHLAMALFKEQAKIDIVHVPYKGGAPALVDLAGGQIQLMVNPALSSMPLVKAGKLKVLAITSAKRALSLPDVPTVAESGLPAYEVESWYGLFAPAGTPISIVTEIATATRWALSQQDFRARLAEVDAKPIGSTPQEFAAFVKTEIAKWREIVRIAGVKEDENRPN